jgi:ABC-2 type transport system permease protein
VSAAARAREAPAVSAAARAPGLGTVARLTWRQWRLERRLFWRNPSAAFFNFVFPLLLLGLFGAVFAGSQHDLNVIVPGIAGMSVMSTTFTALAYSMVFLREQGVLKRVRGTPLPGGVFLSGLALSALTNAVLQVGIVILAGRLLFGTGWPKDWVELVVFVAAGVVCFAALGVAFSHVIPSFDAATAYVNAVFLPTIFISGVFFDAASAPSIVREVAQVLPLVHVIHGLSGALVTGAGLSANLGALGVVGLWAAAGILLAVRGFSWDRRA